MPFFGHAGFPTISICHFVCLNGDEAFLPPLDSCTRGAIFFSIISFPFGIDDGVAWSLSVISVGHAIISTAFGLVLGFVL
jgi:hypothetical protein